MPLNGQGRSALETTNGRPLCPHCRVPLWIVHIDERDSDDQLAFECPCCEYARRSAHRPSETHSIRALKWKYEPNHLALRGYVRPEADINNKCQKRTSRVIIIFSCRIAGVVRAGPR